MRRDRMLDMKTKTVFSLVSLLVVALSHPAWARGGGGGGGAHFGGGGFGGGGGFWWWRWISWRSRISRRRFWRTSLLVRRAAAYGRPVYVRPQSQIARPTTHAPVFRQPRSSVSAMGNRTARTTPTSHSVAPNSAVRPSENARNHIFAREDGNRHRDWDRRGAHFWNGHWWAWDEAFRIGLDDGFYPWDYYPYYAYDYYPSITTLVTMRTLSPTTITRTFTIAFPRPTQT